MRFYDDWSIVKRLQASALGFGLVAAMLFLEEPTQPLPLRDQPGLVRITRQQLLEALSVPSQT